MPKSCCCCKCEGVRTGGGTIEAADELLDDASRFSALGKSEELAAKLECKLGCKLAWCKPFGKLELELELFVRW